MNLPDNPANDPESPMYEDAEREIQEREDQELSRSNPDYE